MWVKRSIGNAKGIVLVTTLLILSLLMGAGTGVIVSTRTDLRTTGNLKRRVKAFYIAQAGLEHAWQELMDGDGVNDFRSVYDHSGISILFQRRPFSAGSYSVTAKAISGTNPNQIQVVSSACLPAADPCPTGHSLAVIEGRFIGESIFSHTFLAKETITLSGDVLTDSFDSRVAPYAPSRAGNAVHLASNGDIFLAGAKTEIRGDVTAGGSVTSRGARVTGVTTHHAPSFKIPTLHSPCHSTSGDGSGITGGHYDAHTGQLKGIGSGPIILSDGTYCFSSIDLDGDAKLTVNGPVTIYLFDKSDLSGGQVNNTTHLAGNLKIISLHSSPHYGITLAGGKDAYMVIYAKNTGVKFTGKKDFFGAVVAARIDNRGGTSIHFDRGLQDDLSVFVKRISWRERF